MSLAKQIHKSYQILESWINSILVDKFVVVNTLKNIVTDKDKLFFYVFIWTFFFYKFYLLEEWWNLLLPMACISSSRVTIKCKFNKMSQ